MSQSFGMNKMSDRAIVVVAALTHLHSAMEAFVADPSEDTVLALQTAVERYSSASNLVLAQVENLIKLASTPEDEDVELEVTGNPEEGYEL